MAMARTGVSEESMDAKKPLQYFEVFVGKMRRSPRLVWQTLWKVGEEDPRRIIHSLKVGLSLTLVSLLYLLEPLFVGIGKNAIWAVMTVVVVLEFTVGATLGKGLNRGFGTLCAGSLAFFIEYVADKSGKVFQAFFIGIAVLLIGTASTYIRFIPYIKKNYDYGVLIFLLTFNLITVSSFRVDNILQIAHERFYTIAIGCGICLLMTLLIFPNWSGQDLHNSTVRKLEGLARTIEACVNEYFQDEDIKENECNSSEDPIYKGYKAVLDSKSSDETLASYASWEPRHWRHCSRYPWQRYVKLGTALRHLGYTAVALHGCLQSEIQTPKSVRDLFQGPCIRLSEEVSKALMELADSIRKCRLCASELFSDHLNEALQNLNSAIKLQPRLFLSSNQNLAKEMLNVPSTTSTPKSSTNTPKSAKKLRVLRPSLSKIVITSLEFSEALPFAAFASLLVETVARLDLVIQEVEELGRLASFKEYKPSDEVIVTCGRHPTEKIENLQNNLSSKGRRLNG